MRVRLIRLLPLRAVRIGDDLWARLLVLSEATGIPIQDIVEDSVSLYLRKLEK